MHTLMRFFLIKRCLTFFITLMAASVVVFFVLEVLPGNAAEMRMGTDASPEALQALTQELGLDKNAMHRYGAWMAGLFQGDMGISSSYDSPVNSLILERLTLTMPLAIIAMLIATALALAAGVLAASQHQKWGDTALMGLAQIGIAVPNFWFAILLILLFSVYLQWLPAGGFPGWEEGIAGAMKALVLPALSLAVVQAAVLARITRSALLEVLQQDFIRTARAKGLSRNAVLWCHALRNALIPVITVMGLQFSSLLAGTIVIENVFYLPGLGQLIFQSIANRDLVVVRNCVLLLATMAIVVNFVVDICYHLIDPRIQVSDI